jgi:hypothetical protein
MSDFKERFSSDLKGQLRWDVRTGDHLCSSFTFHFSIRCNLPTQVAGLDGVRKFKKMRTGRNPTLKGWWGLCRVWGWPGDSSVSTS